MVGSAQCHYWNDNGKEKIHTHDHHVLGTEKESLLTDSLPLLLGVIGLALGDLLATVLILADVGEEADDLISLLWG